MKKVKQDIFLKLILIADKYNIKVGDVKKLIPNLGNKTKYVVHYRNLQFHLSLGMKLTKIHRVLQFKQSNWKKKCIDFNTKKRMGATNDLEKEFFHLMINSVYGNTMENFRKRINVRFVNNKKIFLNIEANQLMLPINYLIKIFLLFMK